MDCQKNPQTTPTASSSTSAFGSSDLSLNLKNSTKTTSAPSSPAKNRESLLQRVQSLTGQAREQGAQIIGAAVSTATSRVSLGRDKYLTLLAIDDPNTDWSKYFRGKRLHNDYEIRVEQCEFRDLSLSTTFDSGLIASLSTLRNGTHVTKTFKPDFALIRQNLKDGQEDYKNILLGFQFANIHTLNSLSAIYNFQDKPWVFGQLTKIQRRIGKENFPLIEQTYYPNYKEMLSSSNVSFPIVVKMGHAHGGVGKIRICNQTDYQDIVSIIQSTSSYCTVEPYIDSKYDIHVQKIGNNYKAFMRKSISGNWKTNMGSAMLEQLPLTDRYKFWIDEISQMFGGLDICALEAVVAKDGQEYIIEVNDSALSLMGDSQEEDRRQIADLVASKMQGRCRPPIPTRPPSIMSQSRSESAGGSSQDLRRDSDQHTAPQIPPPPPPLGSQHAPVLSSIGRGDSQASIASSSASIHSQSVPFTAATGGAAAASSASNPSPLKRDDSTASASSFRSVFQRQNSQQQQQQHQHHHQQSDMMMAPAAAAAAAAAANPSSTTTAEDSEDTMKNLRKTFAGIFGDM